MRNSIRKECVKKGILKKHKKIYMGKALLAFVLLLSMVCSSMTNIRITFADEQETEKFENLYCLKVQTGNVSGGLISQFVVAYVGEDGCVHRQYISPKNGDYKESMDLITGQKLSDKANKRINLLKELSYDGDFKMTVDGKDALQKNSTDYYFFQSYFPVSSVYAFGVMSDVGKTTSKSWSCYGMDLYRVDSFGEMEMTGSVSGKVEPVINGENLASLAYQNDGTQGLNSLTISFDSQGIQYFYADKKTTLNSSNSTGWLLTGDAASKTKETKSKAGESDTYTVKIDLVDEYMAGIEAYINSKKDKTTLKEMKIAEPFVFKFSYLDSIGATHNVSTPVLLSSLIYAMEKAEEGKSGLSGDSPIVDLVYQGGSLVFTVELPGMASLKDVQLVSVDSDKTLGELTGLKAVSGASDTHKTHYTNFAGDQILYDSIQIYSGDCGQVEYNGAQVIWDVTHSEDPIYFTCTETLAGRAVDLVNADPVKLSFRPYDNGQIFTPKDTRQLYLLEIQTGDTAPAQCVPKKEDTIKATVKYFDTKGRELEQDFDLRKACNDFYGYWTNKDAEEVGFEYSLRSGGSLYALMNIKNVDYFTGMKLDSSCSDDWLAKSISIYEVTSYSTLQFAWTSDQENTIAKDSLSVHSRKVNGKSLSLDNDASSLGPDTRMVYVNNPGTTKTDGETGDGDGTETETGTETGNGDGTENGTESGTGNGTGNHSYKTEDGAGIYVKGKGNVDIDFSTSVSTANDNSIDIFDHYFNMEFETAESDDLVFDQSKINYTVTVNVGVDDATNLDTDDSGSTNYFYFQLVFEHGNSAYVQANQQLKSDAFREGQGETFNICVNRDYGEITAINLIPEMDEEIGNPYDKLHIDNIEVTRPGSGSLNDTYKFEIAEDDKWVGIDYREKEAVKVTHAEAEIRKTYAVTEKTVSVDLLFALETGYGSSDSEDLAQLDGSLMAEIYYTDTNGDGQHDNVDVVKAMNTFNDNGTITESGNGKSRSDTSLMFRPGSTDRFLWTKSNVRTVDSITLTCYNDAKKRTFWTLDGIEVYLVTDGNIDTDRSINEFGEYVIGGAKLLPVTYADQTGYEFEMDPDGGGDKREIHFADLGVQNVSDFASGERNYVVRKEPASANDTLNFYAYVNAKSKTPENFNVTGSVYYTDMQDTVRSTGRNLKFTKGTNMYGNSQGVYYCKGLYAKELKQVKNVEVSAVKTSAEQVLNIDYVLVQRVRNGVIIDTYRCNFAGNPMDVAITGVDVKSTWIGDANEHNECQQLTMQFGDDMKKVATLEPENLDVAISLTYKPNVVIGDDTYQTKNVFLTDFGITSIAPGQVVTLNLSEIGVENITAVNVSATSKLKIDVKNICIGVYRGSVDSDDEAKASDDDDSKSDDSKTEDKSKLSIAERLAKIAKNKNCVGWYSFDKCGVVKNQTKTFTAKCKKRNDDNTISPITFEIDTLDSFEGYGSNVGISSNDSIRMEVVTQKSDDLYVHHTFNDITAFAETGAFNTGKTAKFTVLMKGVRKDNIVSVTFTPYNDKGAGNLCWAVDNMKIGFGDGQKGEDSVEDSKDRLFKESIDEGESNTVSFRTIGITGKVYQSKDTASYKQDSDSVKSVKQGKEVDVNVALDPDDGGYIAIDVDLTNSDQKYGVEIGEGGRGKVTIVKKSDKKLILHLEGVEDKDVTKTVKIYSIENPDCYITVNITMYYNDVDDDEEDEYGAESDPDSE